MNPNREEVLFGMALEKQASERAAFLNAVCGEDAALRQRIEALLAAHDAPETALDKTESAAKGTMKIELSDELPDETIGQIIGRYKILQKIGEGGCGAVYMAEQMEPVRRRVALKVIKLGMDTKAVIARFEAERQALALMDHPNIAKVLDAGSTDSGRPYFVMELVRGIKITDYCDQNKLGTEKRLELFVQICQAIQHAHQKGIIHRDIKPSNILVTLHDGVPVPKVIDFGIAKATTGQQLTDKTLFTAYEQFIGTPAYMSPEQAEMSGLDIDTRSDIYSLGVLLYELLTGRTPFDPKELMESGLDAMRRTIREKDPVKPSTKLQTLQGDDLTTTAKRHGVEVSRLAGQLRGDLDWIVMKCLEKDRTRRYETANGLAVDIKRHLNMQPVVARPPSRLYEFQKTVRRHKFGFAATAAIIMVLAAGIVMTTWQAVRANVAKHKAQDAEARAVAAKTSEEQQRIKAQADALIARQRAYASDMNVAKQANDNYNLGLTLQLLNRQRPQGDPTDLRGWEWRYLWGQTRSDAGLTLHPKVGGQIFSLAVSSDGQYVAAGGYGGESVWSLRSPQKTIRPAGQEVGCFSAAFSPAGPLLAFTCWSSGGPTLKLWNEGTRQQVERSMGELGFGLAFSKNGRELVTASQSGHITVWRVPSLDQVTNYPCPLFQSFGPVIGFAASSDLSLAAYAMPDGQVRMIDLRDGSERWHKRVAQDHVTALVFSPDDKTLASAGGYAESDICLWDVASGDEIGRLEGHKAWVSSLVFWPDGKKLASGSGDQTIRIWNVADPKNPKCLDLLRGHQLEVYRLALAPDGKTLVSGCKDGTVGVWDTSVTHAKPSPITIAGKVSCWCFTREGESVLTLNPNGQVTQWDGPDFQQSMPVMDVSDGIQSSAFSGDNSVFSSDGRYLATGSTNGVISVWDLSQKAPQGRFEDRQAKFAPVQFVTQRGKRKLLARSLGDNSIVAWDVATGRKLGAWTRPGWASPRALATAPDSNTAIILKGRDSIRANLSDGSQETLGVDIDHSSDASAAAFSPDGGILAIASGAGFVQVFDTANWQQRKKLTGYLAGLVSVAFSPNGKRLVSGGDTRQALRFWDTKSWQDVLTFECKGADFWDTAFSPDGNTIGSANMSRTLHLWHAPSWKEIHEAEAKDPPGYGAAGKTEAQQP